MYPMGVVLRALWAHGEGPGSESLMRGVGDLVPGGLTE